MREVSGEGRLKTKKKKTLCYLDCLQAVLPTTPFLSSFLSPPLSPPPRLRLMDSGDEPPTQPTGESWQAAASLLADNFRALAQRDEGD